MLFLLSPAKTLDFDTPQPPLPLTEAPFPRQSAELIRELRKQSPQQIASLMDLSDKLATLNVARYQAWSPRADDGNSRPAALAFAGDVYEGLQARSLSPADLAWAQDHLCILSGLYGVLRPLDRLQPYRLEMGTALKTRRGKDLYAYWGDGIAQWLNERQAAEAAPVIVNLASVEYARAALRPALRARVVDCVFEDWKGGRYKIISFFAKRARGAMARWAVQQRVDTPARLRAFDGDGYAFSEEASSADRLVFRRRPTD